MAKKNFSKDRTPIEFEIDDVTYYAYPGMATNALIAHADFLAEIGNLGLAEQFSGFEKLLGLMLRPESLATFQERMGDLEHPIDPEQVNDVVTWLLGEYGLRPTNPSSPSSGGPSGPESGTSLTDVTQGVVSTSAASPSTAS